MECRQGPDEESKRELTILRQQPEGAAFVPPLLILRRRRARQKTGKGGLRFAAAGQEVLRGRRVNGRIEAKNRVSGALPSYCVTPREFLPAQWWMIRVPPEILRQAHPNLSLRADGNDVNEADALFSGQKEQHPVRVAAFRVARRTEVLVFGTVSVRASGKSRR